METRRGDRCDGSSLTSYHEVGLQPSRSSHRRVFQPITLTPRMALADLPFNLVDPGGWSNEARSCPIGHVCRLWYHCGGLRRLGGSPATLPGLVFGAGHGCRGDPPRAPREASGGAENVRYTYSRAVGLGYAPSPGTRTTRPEPAGQGALPLCRAVRLVLPVGPWPGRG